MNWSSGCLHLSISIWLDFQGRIFQPKWMSKHFRKMGFQYGHQWGQNCSVRDGSFADRQPSTSAVDWYQNYVKMMSRSSFGGSNVKLCVFGPIGAKNLENTMFFWWFSTLVHRKAFDFQSHPPNHAPIVTQAWFLYRLRAEIEGGRSAKVRSQTEQYWSH